MGDSYANAPVSNRAFTLLELMVVLAILLTLTALVLPTLSGTLGERAFDSAIDSVRSQALMARAHAQRTGAAVDLRYETDPPRVLARLFDPAAEPEGDPNPDRGRPVSSIDNLWEKARTATADESGRIGESWASIRLDRGITLTESDPHAVLSTARSAGEFELDAAMAANAESGAVSTGSSGSGSGGGGGSGSGGPIRLAVFLPDGSAILQNKVWLVDVDDRVAAVTINSWLGLPSVQRQAPSTVAASEPKAEDAESPAAADEKSPAAPGDDVSDDGGSEEAQP